DVSARVALGDVTTTIVELLAARQGELDLGPPATRDVQPERADRLPPGLGRAEQLVELGWMEQQLARPLRLVVVAVALLERRDVRADQPRLPVLDPGVRI